MTRPRPIPDSLWQHRLVPSLVRRQPPKPEFAHLWAEYVLRTDAPKDGEAQA